MRFRKIMKVSLFNTNKFALVSEVDYNKISHIRWCLVMIEGHEYAAANIGGKTVFMHRLIMGVNSSHVYIDHKNGNGLNNRRCNLRKCSNRHNQHNVRKKKTSKQKYKDIRQLSNGVWEVRMRLPDGRRFSKRMHNEASAVKLYNSLAVKYHGQFAFLQKPPKMNVTSGAQ